MYICVIYVTYAYTLESFEFILLNLNMLLNSLMFFSVESIQPHMFEATKGKLPIF